MAYEWIIDALDKTWDSIDRVVRPQPPESYDALTPCPGWSVKDVLSHLVGFEKMLHGEPVPTYRGEWPSYVHNPIGEFNEAYVQASRDRPGIEVLDELRVQCAKSIAALRALNDAVGRRSDGAPKGSVRTTASKRPASSTVGSIYRTSVTHSCSPRTTTDRAKRSWSIDSNRDCRTSWASA